MKSNLPADYFARIAKPETVEEYMPLGIESSPDLKSDEERASWSVKYAKYIAPETDSAAPYDVARSILQQFYAGGLTPFWESKS